MAGRFNRRTAVKRWLVAPSVAAVSILALTGDLGVLPHATGDDVSEIVRRAGVEQGICLLLDPSPADLAIQIARQSNLLIYLQLPSEQSVFATRWWPRLNECS